ncbi:MAG: DNA-3-methyladenine glycosylase 2 family protein [Candidatus Eremiobacteraeota bacterium]|nr:DNA-3-methyladenine glycosylase 2 family protein [Candidatus Eremiobacteraeota bacterium]
MKRFGSPHLLSVRAPFRLDLTVDALRRLASNVVDVVGAGGTFYRALHDGSSTELIAVRADDDGAIELRATGRRAERWLPIVERMLGTRVDLTQWYARAGRIAWLRPLATALRGAKPPRYPTLWEAFAHAILFQQISIHAAAAIMRRAVELLGESVTVSGLRCVAFPPPMRWLEAGDATLRAAGISSNKIRHLRSAAETIAGERISEAALEPLSTPEAALRLREIPGIGAWSASVILLRGMGRLDTFPLRDSGVARSLSLLAGEAHVDQAELLERLGDMRGMLYYHLLLGRMRNLAPR